MSFANHNSSIAAAGLAVAAMIAGLASPACGQDMDISNAVSAHYAAMVKANPSVAKPFIAPADAPVTPPVQWDGDKPFIPGADHRQFPPALLTQDMLDVLRPTAKAAFGLADVSVQEMRLLREHGEAFIPVKLPQGEKIVRLHPYSMRDPNARLLVQIQGGVLVDQAWPEPRTYRGTIEGMPDVDVAGSITEDGKVSMMIQPRDASQPAWFVQPLADALPGMPQQAHVVYKADDVTPHDATCGVDDFDGHPGQPVGPPPAGVLLGERMRKAAPHPAPPVNVNKPAESDESIQGGIAADGGDGAGGGDGNEGGIAVANVRVQIAYDADVEFYLANGSSVLNTIYDMELIMNTVGLVYQNQVAIAYTETGIIVRTVEPDPYSATNANTLICQFGETWNANNYFPRDVAHLFSGKDFDGTTVGLGWIGAICEGNFNNCNANGSQLNYSIVQSRFTTDLTSRIQDTAHELGHNWNACHCNTGGNCGGGTSNPNTCGIMTSNISGSLTFDSAAISAITSYRDGRPCLDVWQNPTYVNWAYNGTETGSAAQPWNTIFEGLDACLVGGTLNVQAGNYFQNPNIFKAKTINALNGTVRIGN